MKSIDYNYIAIMINSFSGVPIRIYKDNKLAFYYSIIPPLILLKIQFRYISQIFLSFLIISVIFLQHILVTMALSTPTNIRL